MGKSETPHVASSAERQARVDLAAAFRLAVRPAVVRDTYRMILEDTPKYAGAHFGALKRLLDREQPDYAR